jgi:hypothetical protein
MDIVERLKTVEISWSQEGEWCAEAADEIERLREALRHMIRWHDQLSLADIAKAKAALKEKE